MEISEVLTLFLIFGLIGVVTATLVQKNGELMLKQIQSKSKLGLSVAAGIIGLNTRAMDDAPINFWCKEVRL